MSAIIIPWSLQQDMVTKMLSISVHEASATLVGFVMHGRKELEIVVPYLENLDNGQWSNWLDCPV